MTQLTVYGSSDDLVEIDGDFAEEFDNPGGIVAFSDGTLLEVEYDRNGIWRIRPLSYGPAFIGVNICAIDDDDKYSDVAHLNGDLKWVLCGDTFHKIP